MDQKCFTYGIFLDFDAVDYLTLGRTKGVGWMPPPHKVFLGFLLEDKTSAPDLFSSCSIIPCAHFESSLVMVSFYYEV